MAVYNLYGAPIEGNFDKNVLSVNHRGYSTVAPENTLPAYILSKKMGFNYVETDVSYTSDGVAMLLHDATINRTSNGSGRLSELTFEEVRQYDFGSWKSAEYAGTKIPTFEEFMFLCKSIMLHPYIELKSNDTYTREQVQQIVDIVRDHGMKGKVSYISFSDTYLGYIRDYDAEARLGYLSVVEGTGSLATCQSLKTDYNSVFYDVRYDRATQSVCTAFAEAGIPIECWTINSASVMLGLNTYVSGITSDNQIAGKVLYDNYMSMSGETTIPFILDQGILDRDLLD